MCTLYYILQPGLFDFVSPFYNLYTVLILLWSDAIYLQKGYEGFLLFCKQYTNRPPQHDLIYDHELNALQQPFCRNCMQFLYSVDSTSVGLQLVLFFYYLIIKYIYTWQQNSYLYNKNSYTFNLSCYWIVLELLRYIFMFEL